MPIYEYSARHIKKAVVGHGGAEKDQVQRMVQMILGLSEVLAADAADALAAAICHANARTLHGALLDSQILAEVYLELIGGKQVSLALISESRVSGAEAIATRIVAAPRPAPLPSRLLADEFAAHERLIASLGPDSIWAKYAGAMDGGDNNVAAE